MIKSCPPACHSLALLRLFFRVCTVPVLSCSVRLPHRHIPDPVRVAAGWRPRLEPVPRSLLDRNYRRWASENAAKARLAVEAALQGADWPQISRESRKHDTVGASGALRSHTRAV